jgi:uncharacterized membrane protein YccF (DUF307 family)
MRAILNLLWLILGGAVLGLLWWFVGIVAILTIVGIPWARSCFVIGKLMFLPFGRESISRLELTGRGDIGTGTAGFVGNVIWFLVAGIWLAIGHVMVAIADALLIIGIPFAIQHLKLAGIALAPIGKTVVTKEVAEAARRANAERYLAHLRSERWRHS